MVPCSIQRMPGEAINKNVYCPSPPFNGSQPQEVKEGEGSGSSLRSFGWESGQRGQGGR